MSEHVYKQIELTGTSSKSIESAVEHALAKASETIHNLRWFEVCQVRGSVDGGSVSQWQVIIKVGFTLDD